MSELLSANKSKRLDPQKRQLMKQASVSIGILSSRIQDTIMRVGHSLRTENDFEIEKSYRSLNETIAPLFDTLMERSTALLRFVEANPSNDLIAEYAASIVENAQRAVAMYSGLSFFVRPPDSVEDFYVDIEIRELCDQIVRSMRGADKTAKAVKVKVFGLAEIEGVLNHLFLIFQNIISNAFKFSRLQRDPLVQIEILRLSFYEIQYRFANIFRGYNGKGDWVLVSVTDNGPGVPDEESDSIFNLYFTKKPEGYDEMPTGTGMGLAIAKLSALIHGGVIFCKPGYQGQFFVAMPCRASDGIGLELLVKRELSR